MATTGADARDGDDHAVVEIGVEHHAHRDHEYKEV